MARTEEALLIVFVDLTGYTMQTLLVSNREVADTLDGYYQEVAARVVAAGGRVVKFIGDAALAVFPEGAVERGALALLDLKAEVDRYFVAKGWRCELIVRAHFGTVMAGLFGPPDDARYDVLGKTVNVTARLPSTGVALSPEALALLSPAARARF